MPLPTHAEYNAVYFDRSLATPEEIANATAVSAMAGYSTYERWVRGDGDNPDDAGEYWAEIARRLSSNSRFDNKSVLEVGCAKGFVVEDLRALGIEAYGLDVSQYCYDQAAPAVQPFLTVGDALTVLQTYSRNQFDWLFSMRFFECIPDSDIQPIIDAMDFCSRNMFHQIGTQENPNFYNIKTPAEWQAYDWGVQTTLFFDQRPNLP